MKSPLLFSLPKFPGKGGVLSFIEETTDFPLNTIKRVFWVYGTEDHIERGNHAHINSDRIIICLQGAIKVKLEDVSGKQYLYDLHEPDKALFIPRLHWINLSFSNEAMMLALVSCLMEEDQLIHTYTDFKEFSLKTEFN